MAKDILADERHILLIGNQGTGKNKLSDRLCHLMNWPREYMQLHRDTTVQSLTSTPTLKDGVVTYEDSPLIKAIKLGHTLVLDEADKAPTEVVVVLKGLIEDGLLTLDDGRKIMTGPINTTANDSASNIIHIHNDFRLFVLANRPGFPFLGNDFFREAGDCFSSHVIENPDAESQFQMLKAYAISGRASDTSIRKLIHAFDELRKMYEEGILTYPYSVRELVNIIRHMDKYPSDGLPKAVDNVLSWDGLGTGQPQSDRLLNDTEPNAAINNDAASLIRSVLLRHGINPNDLESPKESSRTKQISYHFELQPVAVPKSPERKSISLSITKRILSTRNSGYKFGSPRSMSAGEITVTKDIMCSSENYRWKIGLSRIYCNT